MRKKQMRTDRTNHHHKLRLEIISCASQYTIPDTAGTTLNPACNHSHMRCSEPNQGSGTPDFSYPLVSFISLIGSSLISLILVHNSTIIAEHNVQLSLQISPCLDHESIRSTANTEYSIHPVQHTPRTAYTEHSLH